MKKSGLLEKYKSYQASQEKRSQRMQDEVAKSDQGGVSFAPTVMGYELDTLKEFGPHDKRILPASDMESDFYIKMRQHFLEHPGVGKGSKTFIIPVVCPRQYGEPCRLCDEWDHKMRNVPGYDKEEKKKKRQAMRQELKNKPLIASNRNYCAALPDDSGRAEDIKVIPFGATVFKDFTAIMIDKKYGGDFTDPMNGFPVRINKEKTDDGIFGVAYKVLYDKNDRGPICDDEDDLEALLEAIPDLHEWATEEYQSGPEGMLYTDDQIDRMMKGEDPKTVKTKSKKKAYEPANEKALAPGNDPDGYGYMSRGELVREAKSRGLTCKKSFSISQYVEMLRNDDFENRSPIASLSKELKKRKGSKKSKKGVSL